MQRLIKLSDNDVEQTLNMKNNNTVDKISNDMNELFERLDLNSEKNSMQQLKIIKNKLNKYQTNNNHLKKIHAKLISLIEKLKSLKFLHQDVIYNIFNFSSIYTDIPQLEDDMKCINSYYKNIHLYKEKLNEYTNDIDNIIQIYMTKFQQKCDEFINKFKNINCV